jgi:carbon monoxide dehydrogenase subunit G
MLVPGHERREMADSKRTRVVDGPPAAVWEVLADFGAIARWAPNLDHSCLLGPETEGPPVVGTRRRVQAGRMTLVEEIVESEEETTLAYDISGLPRIVRSVRNRWTLAPAAEGQTRVALTTSVECGPLPPQRVLAHLVARRVASDSSKLLEGLDRQISTRTGASDV